MPQIVQTIGRRLEQLPPEAPDYQNLKTYFEWVKSLPWNKETKDNFDIQKFFQTLNRLHVGRHKLKKRITEYIAVASLKNSLRGNVFCFVGPPSVGKNNLARSIATALGRKIIELRLSELETEESFRGRKREGAIPTPGKILEGIKKADSKNPVILLKGIDHPGSRWPVDPVNALLELFDPEQNKAFMDQYLGAAFDLSDAFFIVTAHTLDDVPQVLEDHLEVFQLNAYTPEEKLRIAKRNLLPQTISNLGLKSRQVKITEANLMLLINQYTREAGVHQFEYLLNRLYRSAAYQLVKQNSITTLIDETMIIDVLGPPRYYPQTRERIVRQGIVTGLVWTSIGGDIIFIEVSVMPGKGNVLVTGQIGEVMRESAEIAVSLARSEAPHFGLDIDLSQKDIHIHIPFGAVQKDGPSAGVTILTALFSWFSKKTVDPSLAMTGEITLRGAVLRVGGIKEKVIAAHRAGIKTVVLPKLNEHDLIEVTDEVRSQLNFKFVDSIDQVLEIALSIKASSSPLSQRAQIA